MVVIYVPQDTRWGDLGKGLGQMLGNVAGGIWDNHVSEEVGKMRADPQLQDNPHELLKQVSARFGPSGVKSLTTLLDSESKVAQLDLTGQEARLNRARAGLAELDLGVKTDTRDLAIAKIKADLAATETKTGLEAAETDYTKGPKTEATTAQAGEAGARKAYIEGPQTSSTQAEPPLKEAQRAHTEEETRQLQAQTNAYNSLFAPADPNDPKSPTKIEKDLTAAGITKPEDRAAVTEAVRAAGPRGSGTAFREAVERIQSRDKPTLMPSDMRIQTDNVANTLPDLDPFLEPGSGKGFWGNVQAWFAKKGFAADPSLLRDVTAGEQNMGHYAESGRGFGGAYRVKLGSDVTPQVQHSTSANVLAVGQIAQAMLARLQNIRQQLEPLPGMQEQLKVVDSRIADVKKRLDTAATFWWASDKVDTTGGRLNPDTNSRAHMHYYYRGQEVDVNLRPIGTSTLLQSGQTYYLKGGRPTGYTADEINNDARQAGVTPDRFYQIMKAERPQQ